MAHNDKKKAAISEQILRFEKVLDVVKETPTGFLRSLGYKKGSDTYRQIKTGEQGFSPRFWKKLDEARPEINANYIKHGIGGIYAEQKLMLSENKAPLFELSDLHNLIPYLEDSTLQEGEIHHISIPFFNKLSAWIVVSSRTMSVTLPPGSVVGLKKIEDKSVIPAGHTYVIKTKEHTLLYEVRAAKKAGHIELQPNNKDFQAITLPVSKIESLFMVVGVIQKEV